jgi:Ser/Thr protein kinase RdoA (MazF antagonist)
MSAGVLLDAELFAALERCLELRGDEPARVRSLERRAAPYRSSVDLEELDVGLTDGSRLGLMFKDLSPGDPGAETALRPAFLYDPLRSIAVHRDVLLGLDGPPRFHGADVDRSAGRYWLFLERVDGVPLDEAAWHLWLAAARWLAGFHARIRASDLPSDLPLLRHDAGLFRLWMHRALSFSVAWPSQRRRRLARIAKRHDDAVERLARLPVAFIHGDFHASNVLVVDHPRRRVAAVDWELAGIGPGLLDLAALASGSLTEQQRRELLDAYAGGLEAAGRDALASHEMVQTLDLCLFQLSVQWMGWERGWEPPPDQTWDWLAEAERIAENLSLEGAR